MEVQRFWISLCKIYRGRMNSAKFGITENCHAYGMSGERSTWRPRPAGLDISPRRSRRARPARLEDCEPGALDLDGFLHLLTR